MLKGRSDAYVWKLILAEAITHRGQATTEAMLGLEGNHPCLMRTLSVHLGLVEDFMCKVDPAALVARGLQHYLERSGWALLLKQEYADRGNLDGLVFEEGVHSGPGGKLTPVQALRLVAGPLKGIVRLHELAYIHNDVKVDNVLVTSSPDGSLCAKLADFGCTFRCGSEPFIRHGTTTRPYQAPEQVDTAATALPASDVMGWALMVLQVLTGRRQWQHWSEAADAPEDDEDDGLDAPWLGAGLPLNSFFNHRKRTVRALPDAVRDVLRLCLNDEPSERCTALEALQMLEAAALQLEQADLS